MTGPIDPYHYQRQAALLATSRGADFMLAFGGPAQGQEAKVQNCLANIITPNIDQLPERVLTRDQLAAALTDAGVNRASEIADWIGYLPDGTQPDRYCVDYWRGVFLSIGHPDDADGPPGIAPGKWRSMRAVAERRPVDTPNPDPLAPQAAAFRKDSKALFALRDQIEDWQQGPFSDLDLRLAKALDWPIADGLMWTQWTNAVEFALTRMLWRRYSPHFTADEKQAIIDWREQIAAETRAAMPYDPAYPDFAEIALPGPQCHPDEILQADA